MALPRRLNHNNGSNERAPSVNRVALKNRGVMEAMPCTCDTNANPQIMAVNIRQAMPPISLLFMRNNRKAGRLPTKMA